MLHFSEVCEKQRGNSSISCCRDRTPGGVQDHLEHCRGVEASRWTVCLIQPAGVGFIVSQTLSPAFLQAFSVRIEMCFMILHWELCLGSVLWTRHCSSLMSLLSGLYSPHLSMLCHCLSSSAQILPLPVSIRNFPLTTANGTSWEKLFRERNGNSNPHWTFLLETCTALASLILVNLHVRVPTWSSPLDTREDSQDARESPLVMFWLSSLAGSGPYSRVGGLLVSSCCFPVVMRWGTAAAHWILCCPRPAQQCGQCLCAADHWCLLFLLQRDGTPDPVPRPWPPWRSRRARLTWRSVAASVGTR